MPAFADDHSKGERGIYLKGEPLPHNKEFSIIVKHTFGPKTKSFRCKEVLYVSDFSHESHYRKSHAMNKGKQHPPYLGISANKIL
jgi:hypothetical protein